jgi:hypothetical protein
MSRGYLEGVSMNSVRWILALGLFAIGSMNLVFNPLVLPAAFANDDCDENDKPCCGTVEPECDDGEWVCPCGQCGG